MQSKILWREAQHHGSRTVCFGMRNDTLVMLSGPRHLRGAWTIRFKLGWPTNKPLGATASYDHTESIEQSLIEDAKRRADDVVEDVRDTHAPAAQVRRDAETVMRMGRARRDPRESRESRRSDRADAME